MALMGRGQSCDSSLQSQTSPSGTSSQQMENRPNGPTSARTRAGGSFRRLECPALLESPLTDGRSRSFHHQEIVPFSWSPSNTRCLGKCKELFMGSEMERNKSSPTAFLPAGDHQGRWPWKPSLDGKPETTDAVTHIKGGVGGQEDRTEEKSADLGSDPGLKSHITPVLVSLGCHNKTPQTGLPTG